MQYLFSICFRCRSLFRLYDHPERWLNPSSTSSFGFTIKRFRSGGQSRSTGKFIGTKSAKGREDGGKDFSIRRPRHKFRTPQESIETEAVIEYFESRVKSWAKNPRILQRLDDFGIPQEDARALLSEFAQRAKSGELSSFENQEKYRLGRLAYNNDLPTHVHVDRIFTNVLFMWAAGPENRASLKEIVSPTTLDLICRLVKAVDATYPAEHFTLARNMRRKVIMHVGPTNSGKTYNALRALAAARIGVYAGPLRLLAHEIWERLNLGQIVPLGAEDTAELTMDDLIDDDTFDLGDGKPAVHKNGNPNYARPCNLITGEEQKFVGDYAPLTSATVEMVSFAQKYDVAVVDEVQMLGDEFRGGGWTNAILGLAAKELHLCGEETAVPLVEAMLKDTGDELIVNRYERLAPLSIEPHSLHGDLSKIRKGDCIVTFSRKGVFSLKRRVEETTGMRCAIVYGRLPPEVRNSQAALFNDPDSGYDVLIGSDAIGMGLNLKIKRVILEAVRKFDGIQERPLSLSQTKQIAGRAGRYGAHESADENVGLVATLKEPDMPFLRRAIASPYQPLHAARINPSRESFGAVASVLPPDASLRTIIEAHLFCSRTQPIYAYCEVNKLEVMSDFIDRHASDFTLSEKLVLMMAPMPWRDQKSLDIVGNLMSAYRDKFRVDLVECLAPTKHMHALLEVEAKIAEGGQPKSTPESLDTLESLHKILVLYMWMSLRHPVAWSSHEDVANLKERTERALEWSLAGLSESQRELAGVKRAEEWALERESRTKIPFITDTERRIQSSSHA